jgi:1-acyl-sn-glycerol-3-phosphate acyltransferase
MARIAGLVGLLLVCAPLHVATRRLLGKSGWPRRFLAAAAWIIGARARVDGEPIRPHSLLVSNHLNWLDILVLGGSVNAAFVAKDELGHPLLHWLADQNGTVYVKRSDVKGAKDVEIRPLAIDYGAATGEVAWFEEPGKANVLRILGRRGSLPVTVHALAPLDRALDRKQLTRQARLAIAGRLGFKLDAPSPIGGAG